MCSHYQTVTDSGHYLRCFGVAPDNSTTAADVWAGHFGRFIRRAPRSQDNHHSGSDCEVLPGIFGLIPEWTQDISISLHTYNARSETASQRPSFSDAWHQARHCIIPAMAIFEPDCKGPKTVSTRIVPTDGEPMGIAGLWSSSTTPQATIYSYTMLTLNADEHVFMRQFRKSTDEKRMVVILPKDRYRDWLEGTPEQSAAFLQPYPAHCLRIATETVVASDEK